MTSSGTDAYTVANREDAIDFMADYAEYGEQRWYTRAIAAEQVSLSWRRMLPGTCGAAANAIEISAWLGTPRCR